MAKKAASKKKGGRPSVCSNAKAGRILAAVERGATRKAACEAEGVSVETFRRWRLRAEANKELYARACGSAVEVYEDEYRECVCLLMSFVRDCELETETRMRAVERVARMLQYLLAVNDKEKYGKSQRVELTGKDGEKLETKQTLDMEAVQHVARLKLQMERMQREEEAERVGEHEQDQD